MPHIPFSPSQQKCMIAIMDRVVPSNEFPSASVAGVLNYIESLLHMEEQLRTSVQSGLDAIDQLTTATFGSSFAEINFELQDNILKGCLDGRLPERDGAELFTTALREFAELCVRLVSEGYYADPGNGGNRGSVSWDMIGFAVTDADWSAVGGPK